LKVLSPIILFVYNRPEHVYLTLSALSLAKLAKQSDLIVFSDGPKQINDYLLVEETRLTVKQFKDNFKTFQIYESDINLGLGKSIINGIGIIFKSYDRVIVLEDDLIVHEDLLVYMNYYLDYFKNIKEVYHVSGFQRDSWTQFFLKPVYLTHFMNCSGWATWKEKWDQLILNNDVIDNFLAIDSNRNIFNYQNLHISDQIEINRIMMRTWAIYWYSTIIIKKGFCVNPKYSFIKNIGDDGSGTNMGQTQDNYVSNFADKFVAYDLEKLAETKFSKYHIIQAYSKKSKIKFNSFKNLMFLMFTKIYNQ
jgi:hypothetical protein